MRRHGTHPSYSMAMNEAFLQYVWQHRLLEGDLATTDGRQLVVERPGELNRDAGPDFSDARLVIGGVRWAGNVEVHRRASDWKQHGHSADRHYDNVILHVVYCHDADITLADGTVIPTLEIASAIPHKVLQNYEQLMDASRQVPIACSARLSEIPDFLFQLSQDRMIVERMEDKSALVDRLLDEARGNWEQACYWLVARTFGGKTNAFPFEQLAKATPLSVVAKIRDNAFRVEALLFGQAGLLDADFQDEYPIALQREYAYLRTAYKLQPIGNQLWKFFRLRPAAFPTLRISQFANLLAVSTNLFSKMLEVENPKSFFHLFDVQTSSYWETHYHFDRPASNCPQKPGKMFLNLLMINALVPLLAEYGNRHGDEGYKERALALLRQLPAEKNRIVGFWESCGVKPGNAAESQALIQRYNQYCKDTKCLQCPLAFRLLKAK